MKVPFISSGNQASHQGTVQGHRRPEGVLASLRARQAQPIVILVELPPEQAFDLWKQYVLGDKPD